MRRMKRGQFSLRWLMAVTALVPLLVGAVAAVLSADRITRYGMVVHACFWCLAAGLLSMLVAILALRRR